MMSVKRISRLSSRPPNQPAMAPIGTPMNRIDELDDERDADADPRAVEEAAQEVPAELVGAEQVARVARRQRPAAVRDDRLEVLVGVRPRREERPEDPQEQQAGSP